MSYLLLIFVLACNCPCLYVSTQRIEFQHQWREGNFKVSNCNRTAVPLFVKELSVLPDPILFGEMLNLKGTIELDTDIDADSKLEADLSIRLQTETGYTEVCDIVGDEFCHFSDLCGILAKESEKCTAPMRHLCKCPFKKKSYTILPISILLEQLPFQLRGTFDITIDIVMGAKQLGCIDLHFCVTHCFPLS